MAYAGGNHCHLVVVAILYGLIVPDRTPWLYDCIYTVFVGNLCAIGEREKGI
jgi:Na+-translocating ferredoxin:NAD+ oxidoreductase RnfD subunit